MGRKRWRPQHVRLFLVGAVFVLAWVAIGVKLVFVQGVQAQALEDQALDQRLRSVTLEADRGTIFDRDGRELALTIEATTVYANPREISDPALTAAQLSGLLGRPVGELQADFEQDTGFVYVARKLLREDADAIRALDLDGVHFVPEPRRVYPSGNLAAQVLGFVGIDNGGLEGVEQFYEDVLAGEPGEVLFERSGRGRVIPQGAYEVSEAVRGQDLVLTLDGELQFLAQQEAAATLEETGAKAVHIVVLDVTTFDVLAMASAPTFDPNEIGSDPDLFRNRAVTDTFEPGSTQKLITVAAAIEEGIVTPDRVFEVPDSIEVFDREYFDFSEHETRDMTVADIVAKSSNVGTILVWQELGDPLLYRYLQGFGLGTYTGIDFPGEVPGLVRPAEEWCDSCGASTAIGYRVAVTPLQMTSVFATVANDGVWMQPQMVESIIDTDGETVGFDQQRQRILSVETAQTMRNLLAGVVSGGTGQLAQVPGYTVGGKTGTTEKFETDLQCPGAESLGCYGEDVVASFIGLAPVDNPRLAIGVFVDSPSAEQKRTGGVAAAPAFSRVMRFALHQLGVPPNVQ
ncbi:MAG: penicillin-binding protein 2 [Acidimicrobiia bacterium]|nr:penicillin-binding protein 2 [Acidimicrobiia bacterium]